MSPHRLTVLLCLLIAGSTPSHVAAAADGSDQTELARRRYDTGKWLYSHDRYAEALIEFQAAQLAASPPELDFNIGQCLRQLGRPSEAADAFRRYLTARPDDPNGEDLRGEIAGLDAQVLARSGRRSAHTHLALGLGTGGLALVLAGVDTGSVVLARRHDAARYDQNRALAITTDLLLPAGAVLAVSALVVYLVDRKASKR